MEMRTHHPSKRGSMEEEDRLSSLPDDLLHSILRLLQFKHAVRTSALSWWWAPQWLRALASSRVLDFTDRDLARGRLPARAAADTMRRCLELHAEHGAPLDVFRVALMFPPGSSDGVFGRDVVGWIASAVARGAREVEVYLTPTKGDDADNDDDDQVPDADDGSAAFVELPGDLFVARNSLARLALGGFSLRAVPAAPTGLAGLRSLSLSHVDIIGEVVRDVVSSCRALEHLKLSSSGSWTPEFVSIRIASETLRVLEIVGCIAVKLVRVTAPALESIAFHDNKFIFGDEFWDHTGVVFDFDDNVLFDFDDDMPALRDVYLSRIRYDPDGNDTNYSSLLSHVLHAPVWTIYCDGDNLPLRFDTTTNIQELQLLIPSEDHYHHEDLESFAHFFEENELPLLDRLFVHFPGHVTDASDADAAAALAVEVVDDSEREIEFVLDSLSFMKLVNFRGTWFELQLLALFLKRAPALEQLVLVTVGEEGGALGLGDEHLQVIQRQVSAMRKASPHARLTVCRSCQDRSQNPVRTRFYDEE